MISVLAFLGLTTGEGVVLLTTLVTGVGAYLTQRYIKNSEARTAVIQAQLQLDIAKQQAGSQTEKLLFDNVSVLLDRVNAASDEQGKFQARIAYLEEVQKLTEKQRDSSQDALERSAMINRLLKEQYVTVVTYLDLTRADQSFLQSHLILMQQLLVLSSADRKELRFKIAKLEFVIQSGEGYIDALHAEIDDLRQKLGIVSDGLYGLPPQERAVTYNTVDQVFTGTDEFDQEWLTTYDPTVYQSIRETLIRKELDGMEAERIERTNRIMHDLARAVDAHLKTNPSKPSTEEPEL